MDYVQIQAEQMWRELRTQKWRQMLLQMTNLGLIVCSALMIWKSLMFVTYTESPVVVVLSGSMEPGFVRGDILFLTYGDESFRSGDITVFKISGRDVPIVHRVIKAHDRGEDDVDMLTKGDNNQRDDRILYNQEKMQKWLAPTDIIGRARAIIPQVGMVTIYMNEYPMLKFALIGCLGLAVMFTKEG